MKIKDNAIKIIEEIMKKSGLDLDLFALVVSLEDDKITISFSDDFKKENKIGSIYVVIDPILSHNQNFIIDYVTNGEKKGLIFKEKE